MNIRELSKLNKYELRIKFSLAHIIEKSTAFVYADLHFKQEYISNNNMNMRTHSSEARWI